MFGGGGGSRTTRNNISRRVLARFFETNDPWIAVVEICPRERVDLQHSERTVSLRYIHAVDRIRLPIGARDIGRLRDQLRRLRGVGGHEPLIVRQVDRSAVGDHGLDAFVFEIGEMDYGFELAGSSAWTSYGAVGLCGSSLKAAGSCIAKARMRSQVSRSVTPAAASVNWLRFRPGVLIRWENGPAWRG
jgi:hypothetical protein